jgi:hypothetical protein
MYISSSKSPWRNAVSMSTMVHVIFQTSFAMSMILKLTSFRADAKLSLKSFQRLDCNHIPQVFFGKFHSFYPLNIHFFLIHQLLIRISFSSMISQTPPLSISFNSLLIAFFYLIWSSFFSLFIASS